MAEGRIIKALSGFYYVKTADDQVYECRGRGVFRKRNITPLVGDFVSFDSDHHQEGYITEIKPRQNELVRPPIANIDQAIIVSSASMPHFSHLLLDRFLVLIESKHIKPIIFISKMDLITDDEQAIFSTIKNDYEQIGYSVELISAKDPKSLQHLDHYFTDKISVISGQSGVGKSSILNALNASLFIETDEISKSLGRGKHTTRHVELVEVLGGLVADTPGFSSLEFDEIEQEELGDCFPEMRRVKDMCRFRGCMHDQEPRCAVKKAVENGQINDKRYNHYLSFLQEIKLRKPRY
ncbi:MAG TPA: ribosome small subunit-dependent GTPase A [Virgibacillus sp.]|nr:ribosome small subunit-dependent GTPase A [Virgibacillus sp.]